MYEVLDGDRIIYISISYEKAWNFWVDGALHITWIGDANAATQFGSKFAAKSRIRDLDGIPTGRVIKELM